MTDLKALIDDQKITGLQYAVFISCFLLNALDGMDVLVISYAAPALADQWSIQPRALGVVFSAGLLGMTLGAMFLAPFADRIGRRGLILISVSLVGFGVLATALVETVGQLIALRFASSLGIGALLASAATMAAEYAPERAKNFIVSVVLSGYPVGATLFGLIAAEVIPAYGWRSIFTTAGVTTLCIVPLIWLLLPESLEFLTRVRPKNALQNVNRILDRMRIARVVALPETQLAAKTASVPELFQGGRKKATIMLWLAFFHVFAALYFLTSWIPKLASNTGLSMDLAIYAGAVFNLGAVFGIWLQGYLSLSFGLRATISAFMLTTAALMGTFGYIDSPWAILTMFGLIGFALQGGFVGLYTIAARLYPTEIRNTGVGWSIGAGRVGAIVGPLVGGVLVGMGLTLATNFLICAIPMVLAAFFTLAIRSTRVN